MNIVNNKRKRESKEKIKLAFIKLIQKDELKDISVTDICKMTGLNRSTFYANYLDVFDLADKIKEELTEEILGIYKEEVKTKQSSHDFLKLFNHMKANQELYNTYFKLAKDEDTLMFGYDAPLAKKMYDDYSIKYHIEFFKAGFNAIVKLWLKNGCIETPEQIEKILKDEYTRKLNN